MQHEECIGVRIGEQCRKSARIAVGIGIADDVDRVGARPGRRHQPIERRYRRRRELGESAAFVRERVACENAEAAAVGQDGEPVAADRAQRREALDSVEQLFEAEDAQHAGAPEGRVIDRIRAGERAGVGGDRSGAHRKAAGLHDDHRLAAGGDSRRRHEFSRRGDRFDIKQDRAGILVGRQEIEHVADIDVRHLAERHEIGKADLPGTRPVDHRGQDRAGLRQEGKRSGSGG